jgi:pyruvate/2-oxoglutarate/acetoin dehydrogenase E1 component
LNISYKQALIESMTMLAMDPAFRLVGYGLRDGKGGNGTLKMVPNEKVVETTVCEQLMMGMAQGMAMAGLKPLIFLERFDFIFHALDCLVNHLDKCADISRGEFNPCCIIRIVVGNSTKPLFTGPTHTQNHSEALRLMLKMPVLEPRDAYEVLEMYRHAKQRQDDGVGSTVIVERKDFL